MRNNSCGGCRGCGLDLRGGVSGTGSDMITTVAGVYDTLSSMRRCRIYLSNRCYHLISRVAHRACFLDGMFQAKERKPD